MAPRGLGCARRALLALALGAAVLASCSSDGSGDSGPAPLFPADYASTFTEVRNCRSSTEHEFSRVRLSAEGCTIKARLFFDAPAEAYTSETAQRNHYRFHARIKLEEGPKYFERLYAHDQELMKVIFTP